MYEYTKICKSRQNLKYKGDKLVMNLLDANINSKYLLLGNHIIVSTDKEVKPTYLEKENLQLARHTSSKEEDIYNEIKNLINPLSKPDNFAIKVDRKGEHKYNSTEIARNLAGAAFEKWEDVNVKLKKPSLMICVQIINNRSVVYFIKE